MWSEAKCDAARKGKHYVMETFLEDKMCVLMKPMYIFLGLIVCR